MPIIKRLWNKFEKFLKQVIEEGFVAQQSSKVNWFISGGNGTVGSLQSSYTACISGTSAWGSGTSPSLTGSGINGQTYPFTYTYPATQTMYPPGATYFYFDPAYVWPFTGPLPPQELALVKDFKERNPDFGEYSAEISYIIERKPGLKLNVIFISLLYDLAKDMRRHVDEAIDGKPGEMKDGETKEG